MEETKEDIDVVGKWTSTIPFPPDLSDYKCKIVATLLENQEKYLDDLTGEYSQPLIKHLGYSYKTSILNGLANAAFRSNIWDMIATQPMTGPSDKVFYFTRSNVDYSGDMPEIRMDLKSKEVLAHTRGVKSHIHSVKDEFGRDAQQDLVSVEFAKAFNDLLRELLGDLLHVAKGEEGIDPLTTSKDHLLGAILNQATEIHRKTMRGPANRIVCHSKHRDALNLLNDRFIIFSDWKFPEDEILLFYNGPSCLDQPYIFAPFRFGFHEGNSGLYVVHRHAKHLVHSDGMALVQIED